MSSIDFNAFTWFELKPKSPFAITIPNSNQLNLNEKLTKVMPTHIAIGALSDGSMLYVKEQLDSGFPVPKSSSIKNQELIQFLVRPV